MSAPWRLTRISSAAACLTVVAGLASAFAQASLTDAFQDLLTCAVVEPLLADMSAEPVYAMREGQCVSRVPDGGTRDYFVDAACGTPLDFRPTSLESYCALLQDDAGLGEGQGIEAGTGSGLESGIWTLSPGSRLDIGARSLDGVQQPYLQRQVYRTVQTESGSCTLEMRVYAPSPLRDGHEHPSLLALHGGSWSARGFGFFGLELSVPHYVNQGFVVYAPFYRLLDNRHGSPACNGAAIEQLVDDATAALAWVREHAADYGSSPVPVVFGQSAGAHLAARLAIEQPDSVAAAVLFYAPLDFTDFALRAQQGYYTDAQGLGILRNVLGVGLEQADISASPIPENSFPQRIVQDAVDPPPVFMLQGMQDTLVEARQSGRLCDALAGRELLPLNVEVERPDGLREIVACGGDSQLQLVSEGEHALDICLSDTLLPNPLCPSGGSASREAVAQAIGDATRFASLHAPGGAAGNDEDGGGSDGGMGGGMGGNSGGSGSGSGTVSWLWLIAGLATFMRRAQPLQA